MFNELAHTGLTDTAAAENLHCVAGSVLRTTRRVHLQETNGTKSLHELIGLWVPGETNVPSEMLRLLLIALYRTLMSINTHRSVEVILTMLHIW